MATVLITRPRGTAEAFADELEWHGYASVIEPLLVIEPLKAVRPVVVPAAIMITSAHALITGQGLEAFFGIPCFCVGPRSAAKARDFGFREVHHAAADGTELARLVAATLDRAAEQKALILHICGQDIASAAQDGLTRLGHNVVEWVVYAAHPAGRLSEATAAFLREGKVDAVTVFSPRTAEALIALLRGEALEACSARLAAIGLSNAVVDALRPLPWKILAAAAAPTEEAVIARLKQICPAAGVAR